MVNSIFKKHLCEQTPKGWLIMSPLNKRLPWMKWGVSLRPTVLSKRSTLSPSHHPDTGFKTPRSTLLVHIWGNKLETNNSKWALGPFYILLSRQHVPRWRHSSFPALSDQGWGGSVGATPFPVHSFGPKWILGFEWDFKTGHCSLGKARAISISKDNPSQLSGRAKT